LVAGACAVALSAAQATPSAPHLTLEQRSAFLLAREENVNRIAPAAKSKIQSLISAYGTKQQKLLQKAKPDEKAIADLDRQVANQLLAALSGTQRAALLSATMADLGPGALQDDDVAKRLNLSPAQRKRVAAAFAKADKRESQLEAGMADSLERAGEDEAKRSEIVRSYDAARVQVAGLRREALPKALAVLTPAQRKTWLLLTGGK